MKQIQLITRADDAGNSQSANHAIAKAIRAGFIKNVSVMAPGRCVEEAAQLFSSNKNICFGLHGTLNAEWDRMKWGPVSDLPADCGLLDTNGMFHAHPKTFLETKPPLECVMKEYNAQLDRLTRLGFHVQYVDSHMLPEQSIPGMDAALADWAKEKGLLDHMYYYAFPPGFERVLKDPKQLLSVIPKMPGGQYFIVAHPAFDTEEFRMACNDPAMGKKVAKERSMEALAVGSKLTKLLARCFGITPLRYDEATPQNRWTVEDICRMLGM